MYNIARMTALSNSSTKVSKSASKKALFSIDVARRYVRLRSLLESEREREVTDDTNGHCNENKAPFSLRDHVNAARSPLSIR